MCCTASSDAGPAKLDFAHVAHVEQSHAGAHRHVLGDQAAARARVLDRHVPAAEVDHLGLEGAVRGVEGGLLQSGSNGRFRNGHGCSCSFRATVLYPANDRHCTTAGSNQLQPITDEESEWSCHEPGSRNRYADRLRLCLLSWMADPLRPLRAACLRIGRSGSCSRSLALHPQAARASLLNSPSAAGLVETLLLLRTPERGHTQVEEHDNNNHRRPERPMVRSLHIAESRPPQNRAEDQHRQKKEDTDDFKPYLSAHALKRPQKAADASRHSARGLSGDSSARCGIRGSGCRVFRLSARCLARRARPVPAGLHP